MVCPDPNDDVVSSNQWMFLADGAEYVVDQIVATKAEVFDSPPSNRRNLSGNDVHLITSPSFTPAGTTLAWAGRFGLGILLLVAAAAGIGIDRPRLVLALAAARSMLMIASRRPRRTALAALFRQSARRAVGASSSRGTIRRPNPRSSARSRAVGVAVASVGSVGSGALSSVHPRLLLRDRALRSLPQPLRD